MYKQDLALNSPKGLLCHKIQLIKHPGNMGNVKYLFIAIIPRSTLNSDPKWLCQFRLHLEVK